MVLFFDSDLIFLSEMGGKVMKKNLLCKLLVIGLCVGLSFPVYAFDSIKRGDRGDNVKTMQQKLIDLGYLSGDADGAFGAMTEEAVLAFQKDHKLDATGIVGESTYNVLMGGTNTEDAPEETGSVSVESTTPETTTEEAAVEHVAGELLDNVEIIETDYEMEITDAGYSISNGYLYYSVFIHNNSDKTAYQYPVVRITARNAEGSIIGTYDQYLGEFYPESDYVWAGLAFDIAEEPSKVEFELSVDDYNIVTATSLSHNELIPLEIKGINEKEDGFGGKSYMGEVVNPNTYDIGSAAIIIVYRNENGSLLGGDVSFVDNVKAGKTAPFEINPITNVITENYEIYAIPW